MLLFHGEEFLRSSPNPQIIGPPILGYQRSLNVFAFRHIGDWPWIGDKNRLGILKFILQMFYVITACNELHHNLFIYLFACKI